MIDDKGRTPVLREVPFTRAPISAAGAAAVASAIASGQLKAGGPYTRRCERALRSALGTPTVLMLHSCTAALELAALLLRIGPGDEVIVPSFGFASAASAFALRGATPVFVDISPGTLNVDPDAVAAAVTAQTRAIVAVHYAGVAADLDRLEAIADEHRIALVEDAAQGIGATHRGRPLGTVGALGAISFDATKNLSSGNGGALVVNDPRLVERAETLRDYGTDRARFVRGEVERYRWVEVSSNFAMNELAAAYLWPQLEEVEPITAQRLRVWRRYHQAFAEAEAAGRVRRPVVPADCVPNGHIYALVLPTPEAREVLRHALAREGIEATFHYVPLHSAPAGLASSRSSGALYHTDDLSARLLRLPLHADMDPADLEHVIRAVLDGLEAMA